MRYAFLSDVHGRRPKLQAVLTDAHAAGAQQIISLGDVGGDDCLALLREAGAEATFGNYEVSSWRRLAPEHRAWVRTWPPLLAGDEFLAVHAVPWKPKKLHSVEDYFWWLRSTNQSWRALFPYLTEDEDHRWQALAELEAAGKAILFHGHTHLQAIWCWEPNGHLRQVHDRTIHFKAGHRYIVGTGSVGLPEDGCWAAYALYDAGKGVVELKCLDASGAPSQSA
jgi:predicted phosphodiesterase